MPLPTAILFTLSLFVLGMVALGWWLDPAAPTIGAWFSAKMSDGGLWTGLVLFLLLAAFLAWRGDRAAKGKPTSDR